MTITRTPTRDSLTCLICGAPGPGLDFDHVKERSTHPQLKRDPANIAPLCRPCHRLKSIKRIKTKCEPSLEDGSLWYVWEGTTFGKPSGQRQVVVSKRHGCLIPIEDSVPVSSDRPESGVQPPRLGPVAGHRHDPEVQRRGDEIAWKVLKENSPTAYAMFRAYAEAHRKEVIQK